MPGKKTDIDSLITLDILGSEHVLFEINEMEDLIRVNYKIN